MTRALLTAALAAVISAAGATGVSAAEVVVRVTDRFEPSAVTVPVGATVTWHNADDERHRVRSTTGPEKLDSGNLDPAQTWSHTFSVPGEYRYVDGRDADDEAYRGTVTVTGGTDASADSPTAGGGQQGPLGEAGSAVTLGDRSFSPASLSVAVGTTVTWSNDSDRDHTVTADDGTFDSGEMPPGARFTHTFDQAGSYAYFCAFHSGMRGTVVVGNPPGGGLAAGGSTPAQDAPAVSADVEVRDFAFEPPALAVPAGATVTWRQAGEAPHTVTAEDATFDSGVLQTGGVFTHTFTDPGTFAYLCRLHPEMVAEITVGGGAAPAPPGAEVGALAVSDDRPAGPGPPVGSAGAGLAAVLLLIAVGWPAALLLGAWRIERALRRLATPPAPPDAARPRGRT